MRRLLIPVGILLVIAILGVVVIGVPGSSPAQAQTTGETVTVQRLTLNTTVGGTGTIEPERLLNLAFQVGGTVTEVLVSDGDTVTAGQVLAKLDTADLEYQVSLREEALLVAQTGYNKLIAPPTAEEIARAEANLASAQAQLKSAQTSQLNAPLQVEQSCSSVDDKERDLNDARSAYDQYVEDGYRMDATFIPDPDSTAGVALRNAQTAYDNTQAACNVTTNNADTSATLTSAESNVNQAQAALDALLAGPTAEDIATSESQVRQAELQLNQAKSDLANATLTAPFAGVVAGLKLVQGQNVTTATPALTLIDIAKLHLDVAVNEADVLQLAVGQPTEVRLDALDDTLIAGTVGAIDPVGTSTQGVVTYTVRIDLDMNALNTGIAASATAGTTPGGFFGNLPSLPGGDVATMQRLLPILQKLGGVQAFQGMFTAADGLAQFTALIEAADLSAADQAVLDDLGGVEAVYTLLSEAVATRAGRAPAAAATTTPDTEATATDEPTPTAEPVAATPIPVRVGMTAEAEIIVQTMVDALVVPSRAVRFDNDAAYLLLENGTDEPLRVPVTRGISTGGYTVIEGDITEGQLVHVPEIDTTSSGTTGFGFGLGGGAALRSISGGQ